MLLPPTVPKKRLPTTILESTLALLVPPSATYAALSLIAVNALSTTPFMVKVASPVVLLSITVLTLIAFNAGTIVPPATLTGATTVSLAIWQILMEIA